MNGNAATLICDDAVAVLDTLPIACADMVYLDPPFGNGQLWVGKAGAFSDRHAWNDRIRHAAVLTERKYPLVSSFIGAAPSKVLRPYLHWMASLLAAIRRILHPAGTMWLHCDDTASHYIKIVADLTFGHTNNLGELIWRRTPGAHKATHGFSRVHDTILVFARSRVARWRLWRIRSDLVFGDPCSIFGVSGFLNDALNSASTERIGYPTQKPVALLRRLIAAATLPGALVVDPVCGSGTTVVSAIALGRKAIGIDMSADAIATASCRLDSQTRQGTLFT